MHLHGVPPFGILTKPQFNKVPWRKMQCAIFAQSRTRWKRHKRAPKKSLEPINPRKMHRWRNDRPWKMLEFSQRMHWRVHWIAAGSHRLFRRKRRKTQLYLRYENTRINAKCLGAAIDRLHCLILQMIINSLHTKYI